MPVATRRIDRGTVIAEGVQRRLGEEIRALRTSAGMSQQELGAAAGVSHAAISRIERARAPATPILTYARVASVLGARFTCRLYPEGPPVRDQAHLRLLRRLLALLPSFVKVRTEVGLGIVGDLRAWDAVLQLLDGPLPTELESVPSDVQAMERRFSLKMQDARVDQMLLVVADTRRNRAILREHRDVLRGRYPVSSRVALAALRAGRRPPGSAIILL